MNNVPSKWYEFSNHKEIKRLRTDLNDTFALRIEIAASLALTILSSFFSDDISQMDPAEKKLIYASLCLGIVIILLWDYLRRKISLWYSSGVFLKGKYAIKKFDEEIVYEVLVAYEYYFMGDENSGISKVGAKKEVKNGEENKITDKMKGELKNLYLIEARYYMSSAMKKLFELNSNLSNVLGDKGNKISFERMDNIISLIDEMLSVDSICVDESTETNYKIMCNNFYNLKKNK